MNVLQVEEPEGLVRL